MSWTSDFQFVIRELKAAIYLQTYDRMYVPVPFTWDSDVILVITHIAR
jgi:hypothetical protein